MLKRVLLCVVCALMGLALGGCWNYRGLDQMAIVVGVAVDFDNETNMYKMSYEVVDLAGEDKEGGKKGLIIESEGKTLFDAARNAKRKESDRLFFGSAYIVVISQEIAREMGVAPVLEWFLRDGECRETMYVAVSQSDTAKAILESPDEAAGIMSVIINDIIMEDNHVTSSTSSRMLYEIFNDIHSPKGAAMMPALNKVPCGDDETSAANGMAIFKGDKLAGFLSPDESKYALFVEERLGGGILTLSIADRQTDDISLEIFKNTTRNSFDYEQGRVRILIETETRVSIAENHAQLDVMDVEIVKKIEEAAARMIEKNISEVVAKLQDELNADIFGFGEMIYKRDLPLWRQELMDQWDELFPEVEVNVMSEVNVVNSGFTK
jgi:spore germination protein KC